MAVRFVTVRHSREDRQWKWNPVYVSFYPQRNADLQPKLGLAKYVSWVTFRGPCIVIYSY